MTAILALDSVSAGWHGVPVVHDITFEVAEGEVVALLGPNGAGKTTLVSTIACLTPLLGGDIALTGSPIEPVATAHRMAGRGLGVVPDDRGVFSRLTVRQNLSLAQVGPEARSVDWVLELFPELERLLDSKVGLLSGGEQQMTALAKVLVHSPKVLVVDEMSLGLAPVVASRLGALMRRLSVEEGVAVLLIEQRVDLALSASDRALVINGGRIVLEGTSEALLSDMARLTQAYLPLAAV